MSITAIDYALLIGEMEGVLCHLKKLGDVAEVELIEEIKKKYYRQYFKVLKEEREAENA
mgnify:CR=1 FL=1